MKYTAGQAAKATGVSTATITRALKSGKISGKKDEDGAWSIDPSELHRVFKPLAPQEHEKPTAQQHAIAENPVEIKALERELNTLREALSDARQDRDKWREMAERLSLAPPPPEKNSHKNRGFFSRIFNKSEDQKGK